MIGLKHFWEFCVSSSKRECLDWSVLWNLWDHEHLNTYILFVSLPQNKKNWNEWGGMDLDLRFIPSYMKIIYSFSEVTQNSWGYSVFILALHCQRRINHFFTDATVAFYYLGYSTSLLLIAYLSGSTMHCEFKGKNNIFIICIS